MAETTGDARREHWLALFKRHRITKPKKIVIDLSFTHEQFEKIKLGFMPKEMEDKWGIYYSRNKIYFHRSWTGHRIYTAKIEHHNDKHIINKFYVERNKNRYNNIDDNEDIAIVVFLIANLLGVDVRSIFSVSTMSEVNTLKLWSLFGKMFFRE